MSDSGRKMPLVSIVTPSYNMARFLEETIESVLNQDYPNIEYLVMDGGSSDGTLDLLRRYEGRLRWISERDDGQSDAINKGFQRTQGEIFAFLNADDIYLPGAVSAAVQAFESHPEVAVVYGDAYYTAEDGAIIRPYPTEPFSRRRLGEVCFICQPASFMRRSVLDEVGVLDARMHYALDYELWMRIARRYDMLKLDRFLATSRMYSDNKTVRLRTVGCREIMRIQKRYYGYIHPNWIFGYLAARFGRTDGFFQRDKPTLTNCAGTVVLGSIYNWRRLGRYWMDLARMFPRAFALLTGRLE